MVQEEHGKWENVYQGERDTWENMVPGRIW